MIQVLFWTDPSALVVRKKKKNVRLADHYVYLSDDVTGHVFDLDGLYDDVRACTFMSKSKPSFKPPSPLPPEPKTYKEAMASPEHDYWRQAVHVEL